MSSSAASERYIIRVNKHNWNGQAADMRATLMTWDWRWETALRYRNVEIDFRDVDFMEPWALAMFSCFALTLKEHGAIVQIGLSPANPSNKFFEQAGLLDVLHGAALARTPPRESTGLCVLRTTRDTELFAQRAAELIRGVDEAAADRVRYCVSEFGYNAAQHSHSAVGAVAFAQRFPDRRDVQTVVCDAGRGVLESLRHHYSELTTALESLRLATLPRTSGAAQPGPYGGAEN